MSWRGRHGALHKDSPRVTGDGAALAEAAVNDYVLRRARTPCSSALATLRECLSDKKLGSRQAKHAKHALKDLVLYRLDHQPAAGNRRV